MRLLLIEDDDVLGDALREYLRGEGHLVDWCTTLDQAQGLSSEPYDAWLIDWQLPDGSGLAWLQRQRHQGSNTPALMLTARDRVAERVQGLDAGADDYLIKPFAPEELAARLRVVARRSRGGTGSVHLLAGVEIDMDARTACIGGQRVELTGREWAVLEALLLRAGRIVPKAELERLMTGFDTELASNAVEVHVSALRRKLGRDLIETIRGLGYRVERSS